VLFEGVRVFDGKSQRLSAVSHVLVVDNKIQAVSTSAVTPPAGAAVTRVAGGGRTLMPGLIDAHSHLMFATVPQTAVLTGDVGYLNVVAAKAASEMLMRGFTSVRDVGGPVLGLKRGIDTGMASGPRIWPAGAFASQIKLMAGGVSSSYDPLDVTQYTPAEVLKLATATNGELLALSGLRSPYAGKVGVVEVGAQADLLLVDGDPIANIKLIEDPDRNFVVIMKDGKFFKNALR